MEIYYDTEFIDNGVTVTPLSIGMVREDGKTYYAIWDSMNNIIKAARDPWLKENVLSSFPLAHPIDPVYPYWDESHPDFVHVWNSDRIALSVASFIRDTVDPSLWAWFGSYDHIVLCQLFGKMINMPAGIPQRTNDVAQEAERLHLRVPHMPGAASHNALSDAREVMWRRKWIKEQEMIRKYDKSEKIV